MALTGITGANGKTTTAYLMESILREEGKRVGVIGTINYRYGDTIIPAPVTTPESLDLNRLLQEMTSQGVSHCVMEASSHALHLKRVWNLDFEVGIFTNLTRDHLDFHESMENYKTAKKLLFTANKVKKAVLNLDDPVGLEIKQELQIEAIGISLNRPADVTAEDIQRKDNTTRFMLKTPWGSIEMQTALLGAHNLQNILSAASAALLQGISLETVARGIRNVENVPGRFEGVQEGQKFLVVVDYAHTDDALRNVLEAARQLTQKRVIVVFGCGGDRDRGKRPLMGSIALKLSDCALITSDNPRGEDPESIINDIVEGMTTELKQSRRHDEIIPDRKQAIERAIELAEEGDLVLIAGKGHEDYQILKSGTIHFDDREIARNAIHERLQHD